MGTEQEAVVRSLLDCVAAGDAERAADHYADDASYSYPPWREPIVGRDAIRAALRKLFASCFAELRYTIVNIASTNAVVFTELTDTYNRNGEDVTMHWLSVTEINEKREITAQCDPFDTRELDA
jgi:uncharacterized protein (TIGR02246 family)